MFVITVSAISFICFAIALIISTKTDESIHNYSEAMDRHDRELQEQQYKKELLERCAAMHENLYKEDK